MIIFRTKIIHISSSPDELLTRLKWKTHLISLWGFFKTYSVFKTINRPLVGQINEPELTFSIFRKRTILKQLLPHIIVSGKISMEKNQTILTLKYRLGLVSTMFYGLITWLTLQIMYDLFSTKDLTNISIESLIILSVFIGVAILLLIQETNKTSELVLNTMGINEK
jgi:hypothetical protein